jgi:hypothetical protein
LLPDLLAAAKLGVEMASEGEWEGDAQLERVCDAVHVLDALKAGTYTREQIAALAERAAATQGDEMQSAAEAESDASSFPVPIREAWPTTPHAADMLQDRASLTRDLLSLRDEARG